MVEAARGLEGGIDFGFEATELKLYRSELRPAGAVHTILAAWRLSGSAEDGS